MLKEDGKVILVFDGRFGNPSKLNWEDLDLKTHFSLSTAANHCMVMNDIMIQYYATRQQQEGTHRRHFLHAWPGGVRSNLLRELPWYLRSIAYAAGSLIAVSPETCAEYLLDGTANCARTGEKEARFWSNIDNKGRLIADKVIWSGEQMEKVANHTWELVDGAIQGQP